MWGTFSNKHFINLASNECKKQWNISITINLIKNYNYCNTITNKLVFY